MHHSQKPAAYQLATLPSARLVITRRINLDFPNVSATARALPQAGATR